MGRGFPVSFSMGCSRRVSRALMAFKKRLHYYGQTGSQRYHAGDIRGSGERNLLEFIQNISREKGVTVLITSHDMDELGQLAGRIQSDIVNGL